VNPRHTRELGRKERGSSNNGLERYRKVDPSDTSKGHASAIKFPRLRPKEKTVQFSAASADGVFAMQHDACQVDLRHAHHLSEAGCTLQVIACAASLGAEPKNAVMQCCCMQGTFPYSHVHARLRHGDRKATSFLSGSEPFSWPGIPCFDSGARVERFTSRVCDDEVRGVYVDVDVNVDVEVASTTATARV
jgi:hypothetical protein